MENKVSAWEEHKEGEGEGKEVERGKNKVFWRYWHSLQRHTYVDRKYTNFTFTRITY